MFDVAMALLAQMHEAPNRDVWCSSCGVHSVLTFLACIYELCVSRRSVLWLSTNNPPNTLFLDTSANTV